MKVKKILLISFGIITLLMISLLFILKFFSPNVQPSLPIGIYFKYKAKDYKKGDIIVFQLDEKYNQFYNSENTLLPMKRIIADHTDNISFKNNHIFVNNEDYGEVFELGLKRPNGKIEKNCFYLLSKTKYSFDSRYYGQICKRDIKYKTKLVYEVKE